MANRFWRGGTGTWDAADTTHWSATSGGAGGASVPTSSDNVFFDSSSGLSGATVTISVFGVPCKDFTSSTGASYTFNMTAGYIAFSGNLVLESGIQQVTDSAQFTYTGTGSNTMDFGGNQGGIGYLIINSIASPIGTLTLLSNVYLTKDLYIEDGTLDLNGYDFRCVAFETDSYSATTNPILYLRTGTVTCKFFDIYPFAPYAPTVNFGTSQIIMKNTSGLASSPNFNIFQTNGNIGATGYSVSKVWFQEVGTNNAKSIICGGYDYAEIKITNGVGILFERDAASGGGGTFNIGSFIVAGICYIGTCDAFSGGELTSTHTLNKTGTSIVTTDAMSIRHSVALPSSTWYAGTHSTNNQSVPSAGSGWIFTSPPYPTGNFLAFM